MYYLGGYALHGAYWHDAFGTPRSHGCTNLAPADARWLFYWTDPQVPRDESGVTHGAGTRIVTTP
jgi:lipoprotein-anchoring transpeptidase ErfK/SrfK